MVKVKVAQSCLTLRNLMDYTIHAILQQRILEWVAFPFFTGSSQVSRTASRLSAEPQEKPKNTGVGKASPADLTDPGIEPGSPLLQADSLLTELSGKPKKKLPSS